MMQVPSPSILFFKLPNMYTLSFISYELESPAGIVNKKLTGSIMLIR